MKVYWKITLWYLAFGVVWIFFSDRAIESFAHDVWSLTVLQTIKGLAFVAASTIFIFFLTRAAINRQQAHEAEKLSVFKKTVEGSHHILLNYLNQMQLVTMEAEHSSDFDKSILVWAQEAADEASTALLRLDQVTVITSEEINSVLYRNHKSAAAPANAESRPEPATDPEGDSR